MPTPDNLTRFHNALGRKLCLEITSIHALTLRWDSCVPCVVSAQQNTSEITLKCPSLDQSSVLNQTVTEMTNGLGFAKGFIRINARVYRLSQSLMSQREYN